MRTQSVDTHPEAERVLITLIRHASLSKRFRLVQSLTQSAMWANIHAWRDCHREASEDEAAVHVVSCCYGATLARQVQEALESCEQWHLQPGDLMAAILPAFHAFDQLQVPFYLAGSIASSLYGMQQVAQDIDLVIDLPEYAIAPLLEKLTLSYAFQEDDIREAVRLRTSCSFIHLNSLMKVEMILTRQGPFETSMRHLIRQHTCGQNTFPIWLASACEMLLFKLHRYQHNERARTDGMHDDAEWNDMLGMLKVQGPDLDLFLLEEWATALDMRETLHRALVDAGLQES